MNSLLKGIKERQPGYKKSYSLESLCLATRAPKEVIYNYTTTKTWKYGQLINKMAH